MQILNDSDREFVRNRFENELVNEVNLILFTQSDLGGLVRRGCSLWYLTDTVLFGVEGRRNEYQVPWNTSGYRISCFDGGTGKCFFGRTKIG